MVARRRAQGRAAGTLSVYREALSSATLSEADKLGHALYTLAHRGNLEECYELTDAAVHATDVTHWQGKKTFAERTDFFFRASFLLGAFSKRRMKAAWSLRESMPGTYLESQARKSLKLHAAMYGNVLVERASAALLRNKEWLGTHAAAASTIPLLGLPAWVVAMSVLSPLSWKLSSKGPVPPGARREEAAMAHMARGRMSTAFHHLLEAEEELGREMASTPFYDEKLGVKALALREIEKAFLKAAAEKSWLAKKVGYAAGKT